MAEKRMFTQKIVDSDAFLDMPLSSQALYFHLNMRADDDGFVNNPKKIQRMVGASEDDLKLLIAKRFLLCFENGIIVIKHWRMHNLLRKDRYKETQYIEQKKTLALKDNGSYTEKINLLPEEIQPDSQTATNWQPNGNQLATQYSIGKDSVDKDSIDECISNTPNSSKLIFGQYQNVLLTPDEYTQLQNNFPTTYEARIEKLSKGIELHGYRYNNHYLAILQWAENDKSKKPESNASYDIDELENGWKKSEDKEAKTVSTDPEIKARADALRAELQGG